MHVASCHQLVLLPLRCAVPRGQLVHPAQPWRRRRHPFLLRLLLLIALALADKPFCSSCRISRCCMTAAGAAAAEGSHRRRGPHRCAWARPKVQLGGGPPAGAAPRHVAQRAVQRGKAGGQAGGGVGQRSGGVVEGAAVGGVGASVAAAAAAFLMSAACSRISHAFTHLRDLTSVL